MNIPAMLVYFAVMSITPGPNNLMCLYLGAKGGVRGALRFMSGSFTGLFAKCILCGFLNIVLAEKIPALMPYLKWVGFAYMIYLAYSMVAGAVKKKEDDDQEGESSFRSGILLQVLNIKSWVAALSIFSVYVVPFTTGAGVMILTAATFTVFAAACSFIWCGFGMAIQGFYCRYRIPVSCVMAASLLFCAWSAIK